MPHTELSRFEQQEGTPLPADWPYFTCPPVFSFEDPQEEYQAAHHAAAIFDLTDWLQIELTGDDRVSFLHNFCTADIRQLQPGMGCEAFLTDVRGRILAHLNVFAAPESLWLCSSPVDEEALLAHLDKYLITEDVTITSRSAEFGQLYVSGEQSADVLDQLGVATASLVSPGQHVLAESELGLLVVHRVDLLGPRGYLVSAGVDSLLALWHALTAAGAKPAGAAAFHTLRIEAGFPLYGLDLNDGMIAQEAARTSRAVSFTKGCYLGQEPIARLDALGHTNRELRAIRLAAPGLPAADAVITDETGENEAGRITSAAGLSLDQPAVALALLRNRYGAAGARVQVTLPDGSTATGEVFWPL